MRNISESLIIGFDHCDNDIPCLTVICRDGDKMKQLSTFFVRKPTNYILN